MSFNGDNTCHYEILLYAILLLMPLTKKGLLYAQFIIDMGNCTSKKFDACCEAICHISHGTLNYIVYVNFKVSTHIC